MGGGAKQRIVKTQLRGGWTLRREPLAWNFRFWGAQRKLRRAERLVARQDSRREGTSGTTPLPGSARRSACFGARPKQYDKSGPGPQHGTPRLRGRPRAISPAIATDQDRGTGQPPEPPLPQGNRIP
jgi:hypothetical protein